MPLGWAHCRLEFTLGHRSDKGHLLSVTQDPLLHGMSPWLISEVAAVANVGNTGLFLWKWDITTIFSLTLPLQFLKI